jgi:catechol 2,3-dioxygenase-like lactoylglutathione lyase family enzyme
LWRDSEPAVRGSLGATLWKAVAMRGDRIFDHLGFDVEDINKTVAAMKADGITVTEEPRIFDAHATIAFVDDPDGTRIELVQRR